MTAPFACVCYTNTQTAEGGHFDVPAYEDAMAVVLFPTNRRGEFVVSTVVEVTEDAPSVPERRCNGLHDL